jgi:hypothetical protein
VYYQLDPLSRRSLLTTHTSSSDVAEQSESGLSVHDGFLLSSARSAEARLKGLTMRALGGGEGGVIDLKSVRLRPGPDVTVSYHCMSVIAIGPDAIGS